ncbi:MAG TPA: hypothetical protein VFQ70_02130 [Candidatus Saccharimonadaceae bacterium]|nr:hypothetical protein [Candidatus Saccharimonadaceae bacterium]
MINLLPPDNQRNLLAARSNTLLVRYNVAMIAVVCFMVAAFGFVYFYLNMSKSSAERTIAANQQKEASYTQVSEQAAEFRTNLATAKRIFASQVDYSTLLTSIAAATPSGVILQSLSLDATTFGKPTTLIAYAKNTTDALALKDSYAAQTKLFSNVSIANISLASSSGSSGSQSTGNPAYPVTVTLNLTIQPGAAAS